MHHPAMTLAQLQLLRHGTLTLSLLDLITDSNAVATIAVVASDNVNGMIHTATAVRAADEGDEEEEEAEAAAEEEALVAGTTGKTEVSGIAIGHTTRSSVAVNVPAEADAVAIAVLLGLGMPVLEVDTINRLQSLRRRSVYPCHCSYQVITVLIGC